ncbi:MAG: lipopolysaccharide biosynthesis protein [Actinomycetota bacterium]|nr:lipopolysaccharide biosynthesis protein [Actinomycetota bacterium]
MSALSRHARKGRHRFASARDEGSQRDRALASSAGASLVARIVTALASLVSVGLAARALPTAELGVVSVLTILIVYFGFGDFGLGSMLMTRLPAAHARREYAEMRQLVTSVMSAMLLVALAITVIGTASVFILPWRSALGATAVPPTELRWSLIAFIWLGAVGIVGTVGTRILLALQRGALVRASNSLAAVATVGAVTLCSLAHAPMWTYIIAIAGPTTLVGLVQLAWAVTVAYPYLAFDRAIFDLAAGARCLLTGAQYAVLSLGWVVAYTLDAIVVSSVLGAARAAVFTIAARLFGVIGGTLTVAGQQMWPAISDALARGDVEWVRKRFRHSITLAAATSGAGSLVLVLFGRIIARIWVGAALVPPLSLFIVFAAWTVYMTVMTQYSYLLIARERIRVLALLGLVIAAVNLAASIVFTKWFGLTGPIVGNLVAAGLVQLVPTVLMSRQLAREIGLDARPAGGSRPLEPQAPQAPQTLT